MPDQPTRDPDWEMLVGGTEEGQWLEDIHRKNLIFISDVRYIKGCRRILSDHDGSVIKWEGIVGKEVLSVAPSLPIHRIFVHPLILSTHPELVHYYVAIAGISQKSLFNIKDSYLESGGTRTPSTIVSNLESGRQIKSDELRKFCIWLNNLISVAFDYRAADEYEPELKVALALGGRAVGRGQNISGQMTVAILVDVILKDLRGRLKAIRFDGKWLEPGDPLSFDDTLSLKGLLFDSGMEVAINSGGNVPDIEIRNPSGMAVMVGEIKGRKDLSNAWESWMPQMGDHMRSWQTGYLGAARYFFGTVITKEMVDGVSSGGTRRVGFKDLHREGLLTNIFNITHIANRSADRALFLDDIKGLLSLGAPSE